MLVELSLATGIILSSMFPNVACYLGEDIDDEEFQIFVEDHYDKLETVASFVSDNSGIFIAGVAGVAAQAVFKGVPISPTLKGFIGGGAAELTKNIYKDHFVPNKYEELERKLNEAVREINELKRRQGLEPSILDVNANKGYDEAKNVVIKDYSGLPLRKHDMSENTRGVHENFHRTPAERNYEKVHSERRYERERDKEFGLSHEDRAYA